MLTMRIICQFSCITCAAYLFAKEKYVSDIYEEICWIKFNTEENL